jgi:selenocysteine lyase/cysteine desulfurase
MPTENNGYFLYHSIGQYPGKAADLTAAMAEFATVWSRADDNQWGYLLGQRQEFINLWSKLIGAAEATATTCENVTQGLHMLMTALPDNYLRGKRVLVTADCFPSNHFLLTGLQERLGFTLDTVTMRQGATWVADEDIIARWDRNVGLALITWVSSTTSHKADLETLVAHGRSMGSIVGVDMTQAVGLLPFSVNAPVVDFAVSTSLKWMCGTPGAGILYVRPDLIGECKPELRGWFSQDNPFNWDLDLFDYAPDIRRFDNGTPGIVSAAATVPALRWHAALDKKEVLARNRELTGRLIAAADDLGLYLMTPRAENERGGSIMLKLASGEASGQMLEALRQKNLYADTRGPILRLSPGIMTSAEATDAVIAVLSENL